MNREKRVIALLVVILVLIVLIVYSLKPQHEVDFASDVKPILNKHCISCHGGVKNNAVFSVLFDCDSMSITN